MIKVYIKDRVYEFTDVYKARRFIKLMKRKGYFVSWSCENSEDNELLWRGF